MNITRIRVPKLLSQGARTSTASTTMLSTTSFASRNYAVQKKAKDQERIKHAFEPVKTKEDKLGDAWRPTVNANSLEDLGAGDLALSDSGVLGVSVDMETVKEAKEATEHWKEEVKVYSEETAKEADLGTGFTQTSSTFHPSLKDSASELVAPYAAAASSIGTLAKKKIEGNFRSSYIFRHVF